MLINKGLDVGDVVSIKLINGDEIIARFDGYDHDSDLSIKVSKPLAVTIGPQGLGMIPWVFLGNSETFTIKEKHIFVMVPAKEEASSQYLQGTTGIAMR